MVAERNSYHGSERHLDSLKARLAYAISMMQKASRNGNMNREKAWSDIGIRHKTVLEEELSNQGRYVY